MANAAISKILRFERVYNRKKDAKSTFVMALTYYMGYVITGQTGLLHKANFVLQTADFSADLSIVFARCFVACETENFELLEDLLDQLRSRRNAMKSHHPAFYAHYLYFQCFLAFAQEKDRAANKAYRTLKDFCDQEQPQGAEVLMANLNLIQNNFAETFGYLSRAYSKGERGPLFFVCLARAFGEARPRGADGALISPLILWALNTGCHVDDIISRNESLIENVLRKRPKVAEKLYKKHPATWILHIIATARMIDNDLSQTAFYFYKEAEIKQLYFPQLYDFLLRAAHKNGIEDVSGYSLAQYLAVETNISHELLPFIYHLVLKGGLRGRQDEVMGRIQGDLIAFACRCLDDKLYGKYYYSMYKFLMEQRGKGVAEQKYINEAEEIIKNLLFAYDVTIDDGQVKKILIQEKFKKQGQVADLRDGRLRVNLWSPEVKITCFDESLRNIIPTEPTMSRLVENADISLYRRFFVQGLALPELVIFLANHYMETEEENLSDEVVIIYQQAARLTGVDRHFVRLVNAALGNFYARNKEFTKAIEYFKHLDESTINKKYVEQMLLAYINAGDYAHAARLITRWKDELADKTLYNALLKMAPYVGNLANKKGMAAASVGMMMRGWYDDALLHVALKHHSAPISIWIDLAKSLSNLGIYQTVLFAKILDTANLTRNSSKNVQSVFVQMAEHGTQHESKTEILADFAMFLAYEVLVNGLLPEKPTVRAMEDIFERENADVMAYALAHIYIIEGGAATHRAGLILADALERAEESNILFPIFKDIKDKSVILPYIERNRPFVYIGRPQNEVVLHYKIKDEAEDDFVKMPMKYLGFGMFMCHIPQFYGEEIEYFFHEEREKGSVKTTPQFVNNNNPHMLERAGDLYYTINNALVFEQMFKYEQVEEIVTARLAKKAGLRAKIM